MPERLRLTGVSAVPSGEGRDGDWRTGNCPTVGDELRRASRFLQAAGVESAGLDAQVLLADMMGWDRAALFTADGEVMGREHLEAYRHMLVRRAGRMPLSYITGKREFWSRRLDVDGRVLVPRPETETLVEAVIDKMSPGERLLDVGTGSGNVIVAAAAEVDGRGWKAVDISAAALEVAQANLERHDLEGRVSLCRSDLYDSLEENETFDVIASNPPYVATGDLANLAAEIRCHEPRCALDGGREGLDTVNRLIAGAPAHLPQGGWLIMEIGDGQRRAAAELVRKNGRFHRPEFRRDLAGRSRVMAARRR